MPPFASRASAYLEQHRPSVTEAFIRRDQVATIGKRVGQVFGYLCVRDLCHIRYMMLQIGNNVLLGYRPLLCRKSLGG